MRRVRRDQHLMRRRKMMEDFLLLLPSAPMCSDPQTS